MDSNIGFPVHECRHVPCPLLAVGVPFTDRSWHFFSNEYENFCLKTFNVSVKILYLVNTEIDIDSKPPVYVTRTI